VYVPLFVFRTPPVWRYYRYGVQGMGAYYVIALWLKFHSPPSDRNGILILLMESADRLRLDFLYSLVRKLRMESQRRRGVHVCLEELALRTIEQ
jgi:hypothetical protein